MLFFLFQSIQSIFSFVLCHQTTYRETIEKGSLNQMKILVVNLGFIYRNDTTIRYIVQLKLRIWEIIFELINNNRATFVVDRMIETDFIRQSNAFVIKKKKVILLTFLFVCQS